MGEGHGKPCYYCGKPCNGFAGSPSEWPIPLCHADEPGVVKWHHIGCVSSRLAENERLRREREPLPCGHTRGDLWSEMHSKAEPYCTICRLHTEREEALSENERLEAERDALRAAVEEARGHLEPAIVGGRIYVGLAERGILSARAALSRVSEPAEAPATGIETPEDFATSSMNSPEELAHWLHQSQGVRDQHHADLVDAIRARDEQIRRALLAEAERWERIDRGNGITDTLRRMAAKLGGGR